jgi:hypothetical protein
MSPLRYDLPASHGAPQVEGGGVGVYDPHEVISVHASRHAKPVAGSYAPPRLHQPVYGHRLHSNVRPLAVTRAPAW